MLFGFEINSSYEEIKNRIEKQRDNKTSLSYFIDETFRVIERHPFNEDAIEFLLKEGWACKFDIINCCRKDIKTIKLDKDFILQGETYDFYDRDITLIHELHHAWYNQFEALFQPCLTDKLGTIHEDENRLINEILSRENRAKPWILKKAVESFSLEPQIYDLASKIAFEDNPKARISSLAKKNSDLLKIVLMDGHKSHYEFSKQF
jgi:hypothetical protein